MRTTSGLRALAVLATMGAALLASAAPASAVTVTGPCSGSATINGTRYTTANTNDASRSNPMPLPKNGVITYVGTTGGVTKPHHGHVAVVVGPADITIFSWASPNTGNKTTDTGQKNLTSASKKLPGIAGIYEIKGFHYNNGTLYWSGSGYVKFTDSPLSTPLGAGAMIGTVVTGLALLGAALGKGAGA